MTIFGHDKQRETFGAAMRGERPPHAWLLVGPKGIGKAALASQFSRQLLAESADPTLNGLVTDDHMVAKLCDASSHPDFLMIERLPKDPKAVRDLDRRDWPEALERVRSITIDQVRGIRSVCAMKPSFSGRRIIVVDSIDDMERSAANGLLKLLEEPPPGTFFLLISHAAGKLLPTIRSRCRMLRFQPLPDDVMTAALLERLPEMTEDEVRVLVAQGSGSPGRALALAGLKLDELSALLARIGAAGDADRQASGSLATMFGGRSQGRYEAFLDLVPRYLSQRSRTETGVTLGKTIAAWEEAQRLSAAAVSGSLDPGAVALALANLVASLAENGAPA